MNFKKIIKKMYEKKISVLIIFLISLIFGIIYTLKFVTPMYKSKSTFILGKVSYYSNSQNVFPNNYLNINQEKDIDLNSGLIETFNQILKSRSFIHTVKKELKIDIDERELAKSISIKRVKNSDIIEIIVVNKNYNTAETILRVVENSFFKKIQEIYKIDNIYIIDDAIAYKTPYNINHLRDVFLFCVLGILISSIYVFLLYILSKFKIFNNTKMFIKNRLLAIKNEKNQNEANTAVNQVEEKELELEDNNEEENHQIDITEYNVSQKDENNIQEKEQKIKKEEKRLVKKNESREKLNNLKHKFKRKINRLKKKFLIKTSKLLRKIKHKKEELEDKYYEFLEKRRENKELKKEQKEVDKDEKKEKNEENNLKEEKQELIPQKEEEDQNGI